MIKKVFNSIYLLNDYKLALNVQKIILFIFLLFLSAIGFAQIKVVYKIKVKDDKINSSINYVVTGSFNTENQMIPHFRLKNLL